MLVKSKKPTKEQITKVQKELESCCNDPNLTIVTVFALDIDYLKKEQLKMENSDLMW